MHKGMGGPIRPWKVPRVDAAPLPAGRRPMPGYRLEVKQVVELNDDGPVQQVTGQAAPILVVDDEKVA